MRFEIIVPDSTRPELQARFVALTRRLSEQPELVRTIRLDDSADDAAVQAMFTPELLAQIDEAGEDIRAGNFRTQEQVDATLAAMRSRWLAANPS